MGSAIGAILPLAVGVALSPVPIIAEILMLFSARARINGPVFLLGFVLGIAVITLAAMLLANASSASAASSGSDAVSWVKLALGVLLLAGALRQYRSRPRPGSAPAMPKWMAGIDSFTTSRALALGAALGAVNPKNLALSAAAGATIGQTNIPTGQQFATALIFIVLASASVATPLIYFLLGGDRAQHTLDSWKAWLQHNNATVMTVLFVIFGFVLIGQSIQTLSA
ncbi:MAG: GAP family protein [Solirubrobacteraceae bacterium]